MKPVQYAPGQVLAGTVYRVIRHLATGGMGSVYDVEDTTVEKRYVLKTLNPALVAREDLARRMRDEAKSLAKLQHPNIVDVITAGVTTDASKMPFYVMERLVGQNLRVVLEKQGSLEHAHAYRIASDVADALEHAHENAIVHRDVKPENIFLHRNANGTTTTKLLDFGIVRLLDRKASHTHGKFIGTLRYASPEQVNGGEIGTATDIYSLGVVLFEMLAGRGPFDDAGDAYAIGAAHASVEAPPLSRFARVPDEIDRLVASALAKDPAMRPRDGFVLASTLRRFLEIEASTPRSQTAIDVLPAADPTVTEASPTPQIFRGPPDADLPPTRLEAVSPIAPTLAVEATPEPTAPVVATPMPRGIDREAPTRASTSHGHTQRLASNDTVVAASLAPQTSPAPPPIVFTPAPELPRARANPTGPLAGEARTRPPEHGPFLLGGVATLLAVVVAGAVVVAWKPWRHGPPVVASESVPVSLPVKTPPAPVPPPETTLLPTTSAPSPPLSAARGSEAPSAPPLRKAAPPLAKPRPSASGYSPAVGFE